MSREKPNVWSCEHPLPIEVVPLGTAGGEVSEVRPVRPRAARLGRIAEGAAGPG
jgi:hypothetical protein